MALLPAFSHGEWNGSANTACWRVDLVAAPQQ
jgi:hypothetical protein